MFKQIIIIIIVLFASFSHQLTLMVFYWSLSDSKSTQVSRTLLRILVDFDNPVVLVVSTRPLGIVPSAPKTIGITVTFMSHSFF